MTNELKSITIFVDVDDTFVRSYGTKRIPITATINKGPNFIVGAVVVLIMPKKVLKNLESQIFLSLFCLSHKSLLMIKILMIGKDLFKFIPYPVLKKHEMIINLHLNPNIVLF